MKVTQLILAIMFMFSVCVAPAYNDAYAKTETKDSVEKSTKSTKTSKTKTEKKKDKAAAVPKNININSADKDTLALLPGIGPAKADAIIKYRKDNGNFKSIEDLTKVKGIGDKTLTKLKPYLKKV